jgi:hypothetical protein
MFMKSTINAWLALSLGLVSFVGAGAALAAQPAADAQEQARVLLSGQSLSRGDLRPRLEALSSTTATSIALDAQQQGWEMILGRPVARTAAAGVKAHRASGATAPDERKADALAMAREMILGSQSKMNAAKTRLAGKAG